MIRVLVIGGVPASGKSTIMGMVLDALGEGESRVCEGVNCLEFRRQKLYILGVYGKEVEFPGTDRLSMNIQPKVCTLLQQLHENKKQCTVCFEGDRLFNSKLLLFMRKKGIPFRVMIISVTNAEFARRQKERGNKQDKTWLEGRKSKVLNIQKDPMFKAKVFPNNNKGEQDNCVKSILAFIVEKPATKKTATISSYLK